MRQASILLLLLAVFTGFAQVPNGSPADLLQSGPMLGYSEMREVMLWAQTNAPASVQIKYWELDNPSNPILETNVVETEKSTGYTAHLLADEVVPGKKYGYKLYINGDFVEFDYPTTFQASPDWSYKSDPPNFRVAVGSCFYINDQPFDRKGTPYGGEYEILEPIIEAKPDLMLWLGDNTYYREADWGTKTGMIYRNTHTRSIPELQPLLASTHHYATWDDHDYGPNDHNRTFTHKDKALETFQMFWANPTYGFMEEECAVTQWTWGDADFYMLDNRWFRSANNLDIDEVDYFSKKQIDWLIESMKVSRSNFKIIGSGGQVLNPAKKYENYANYEKEREYLLKRLAEENISGVFFLSGDRHHTELTELPRSNNYPLYDLTVSPLTAGTHKPDDEGNIYQVEKTLVNDRNYAILEFSGKRGERKMEMTIYNNKGKKQWSKTLEVSNLRTPRKEK